MNTDKYLAMTDAFMRQTGKGEIPDKITCDLRFCMDEQEEKLRKNGITMREDYVFDEEAVTGAVESSPRNNRTPFRGVMAYRETVRIRDFYHGDKRILHRRDPVTFHATIVDREGSRDVAVNCPHCGNATMASKLEKGCPYCGTHFSMSELYPRISSCYCTNDIIERFGFDERLKRRFTRIAIVLFLIFLALTIWQNRDQDLPLWAAVLATVFQAGLMTAMTTLVLYLTYSFSLVVKLFLQLGSVLPMIGAATSAKKLQARMEKYDPYFFGRIFEGKLVSLLQAVLYSDDRENLSIYEGRDDLSDFDELVDLDYRGVYKLKEFKERGGRVSILLDVFMDNCYAVGGKPDAAGDKDGGPASYAGGRVKRRNERILVRMERKAGAVTDPGFSIHAVSCGNCGGSFDAMHVRNCPYCGGEYHAAEADWVITEIRKK